VVVVSAGGCIYDADDRCGDDQVMYGDTRCVCAEGSAWTSQGCVRCGENEQASASGCACVAGYARPASDAACEPAPDGVTEDPPVGLGLPCATQADCADTEATWCDTFTTQSCIVQGCSLQAQDCYGGQQCCDFSQFGIPEPLCVAPGTC
jgi:hypothetical protein